MSYCGIREFQCNTHLSHGPFVMEMVFVEIEFVRRSKPLMVNELAPLVNTMAKIQFVTVGQLTSSLVVRLSNRRNLIAKGAVPPKTALDWLVLVALVIANGAVF